MGGHGASIHPKYFRSVMAMTGVERAEYTIKKIADQEELWGLYSDGWASAALDENGVLVFPIWPDVEFASACAQGNWANFTPQRIDLDVFIDKFLDNFEQQDTLIGVFSHPAGKNVHMTAPEFRRFLAQELESYT